MFNEQDNDYLKRVKLSSKKTNYLTQKKRNRITSQCKKTETENSTAYGKWCCKNQGTTQNTRVFSKHRTN
jgi:hypothetical protein